MNDLIKELEAKALWVRRRVLRMAVRADSGHVSTACSQCEILVALYHGGVLRHDPKNPHWPGRDVFILSKGQGGIGLYPTLALAGYFPEEDLDNFCGPGSKMGVHAESHLPGVEYLTGSLGHGLSIAVGRALAFKNAGADNIVYCLVGDGELQEGSNWEAMMFAAHHRLNNLVVLVDRNQQYTLGRTDGDTPRDGPALEPLKAKFESFGFAVWEVEDGNNVFSVKYDLAAARSRAMGGTHPRLTKPQCLIFHTKKGRGLSAVEDRRMWHYRVPAGDDLKQCWEDLGVVEEDRVYPAAKAQSKHAAGMRDRFFNVLFEYFKADKDMVLIAADNGAPSMDQFTHLPGQFYQAGIAEQNMVGMACGLASAGKKVWCYAIAPFVTTRVHEFVKLDACVMNLPIGFIGVGAGYAYDIMGPTHHTVEDIAIMRALPNMHVFAPADGNTAELIAHRAAALGTPHYIRLDRGGLPDLRRQMVVCGGDEGLSQAQVGSGVTIIATGVMTHRALEVADRLDARNEFLMARVLDAYVLKPFAGERLRSLVGTSSLVTLEEHQLNGGLGSIVAEVVCDLRMPNGLLRLGVDDKFTYTMGGREEIHKDHGLDVDAVVTKIAGWLSGRRVMG